MLSTLHYIDIESIEKAILVPMITTGQSFSVAGSFNNFDPSPLFRHENNTVHRAMKRNIKSFSKKTMGEGKTLSGGKNRKGRNRDEYFQHKNARSF